MNQKTVDQVQGPTHPRIFFFGFISCTTAVSRSGVSERSLNALGTDQVSGVIPVKYAGRVGPMKVELDYVTYQ